MPTTYNGIGTHYYGRRNVEKRVAVCEHCGHHGTLTSYDTRLFVVVFFIPIIPLGRKRIVNACPACTWHYAVDADKWEAAKQLEISGALENYRANPSPETAIAAHQELIKFHQSAQAAEFRAVLQEKFGHNAKVQVYLGAAAEHLGQWDDAAASFERALALRPDLPEARAGAALARIRAGRLDEARPLLDFLEKPGAAQLHSLRPLETLARAYQKAGRHNEALQLLRRILEELPNLGEVAAFRRLVEESERALGGRETLLPKRPFSWRRLLTPGSPASPERGRPWSNQPVTSRGVAVGVAVAALVAAGFAVGNEYTRRHRTLHVVVGTPEPIQVEIRGHAKIVAAPGVTQLVLPEGKHHATLRGTTQEEVDFEIRSGYWERWWGHPVWILNPRGAALLLFREAVYSAIPREGREEFHFGQSFVYWPRVTHPFQPLPESLRMKRREQRVLTQVDFFPGPPVGLFRHFREQGELARAEELAQWRLRQRPDDDAMIFAYLLSAGTSNELSRVEAFLAGGLTNRPVRIEWHRAYQTLRRDGPGAARLRATYAAMQQAEPTNSALLYLCGRIATNRHEARELYGRAIASDTNNPYPYYALAQEEIALGQWPRARPLLARATALSPNDEAFASVLDSARLALGEAAALEADLRARLRQHPLQFRSMEQLVQTLLILGRTNEAQQAVAGYERELSQLDSPSARQAAHALRQDFLYACGDFEGLLKLAGSDRTLGGSNSLFQALVELGRTTEAVQKVWLDASNPSSAFPMLTLAISARLAGHEQEARAYREQAAAALARGDQDDLLVAGALRSRTPPAPAELDAISLPFPHRAVLLTFLAQQHPGQDETYKNCARKLDVHLDFPHHLLRRVLTDAR